MPLQLATVAIVAELKLTTGNFFKEKGSLILEDHEPLNTSY